MRLALLALPDLGLHSFVSRFWPSSCVCVRAGDNNFAKLTLKSEIVIPAEACPYA